MHQVQSQLFAIHKKIQCKHYTEIQLTLILIPSKMGQSKYQHHPDIPGDLAQVAGGTPVCKVTQMQLSSPTYEEKYSALNYQ